MGAGALIGLTIGSIAASAIGSVASGIMTSKAQKEANDTNVALAREQMAYQTSEREAVQEYNTPENQRQRLEQAGINPYMALGSIDSGNAQMQTGVTPAQVSPVTGLANMVENLGQLPNKALSVAQMAEQLQGMQEANKQAHVETLYKEREKLEGLRKTHYEGLQALSQMNKNTAEYDSLQKQLKMQDRQIQLADMRLKYEDDYLNSRNKKEREMSDLVYNQKVNEFYESEIKRIQSQYAPQLQQSELRRLNAAASELLSAAYAHRQQGYLLTEQGKTEFETRVFKKAGLRLANEEREVYNSYLGDMLDSSIELTKTKIRQGEQDYYNPFNYVGGAVAGAAAYGLGRIMSAGRTIVGGFR